MSRLWTETDIEELKRLAGTMSCTDIGKQLGRTRDAVQIKIASSALPSFVRPVKPRVKKPAPVVEKRPPMIQVYKNFNKRDFQAKVEVSKIQWCKQCGSPVSDWEGHTSRLGCKRNLQI